ncbi:MAG: hypothetical protein RIR18_199 [Pseudomonadota bacterium]|jgi:UDP-N-acetylmuramate dehydrogenase
MQAEFQAGPLLSNHIDLQSMNTLALPAKAAFYLKVTEPNILPTLSDVSAPRFVLGGGSNLVLTGNFDGLILHMDIPGKQLIGEDSEAWYVEAGAGENWHQFVQWTLANGLPGLENLSLIPGTVGASPIQNIGAYGLELSDFFHLAKAWDFDTRQWVEFDRKACRFAYRDSLFKQEGWHLTGRIVITQVVFRIPKHWEPKADYADVAKQLETNQITEPSAQEIANAVMSIRQHKLPDPAITPNAGSFFQNPVLGPTQAATLLKQYPSMPHYPQADGRVKLAAGWLIEQAGWKGKSIGPVGMYRQQALVLVNHGQGNGRDVLKTMSAVQQAVLSQFQVKLQPEPVFVP